MSTSTTTRKGGRAAAANTRKAAAAKANGSTPQRVQVPAGTLRVGDMLTDRDGTEPVRVRKVVVVGRTVHVTLKGQTRASIMKGAQKVWVTAERPEEAAVTTTASDTPVPTTPDNDDDRTLLALVPADGISRGDLRTAFLAKASGRDARFAGTRIGKLVREGWLVEDGDLLKLVQDGPKPPAPAPAQEPAAATTTTRKPKAKAKASGERGVLPVRPALDYNPRQLADPKVAKLLDTWTPRVRKALEAQDQPKLDKVLYDAHKAGIPYNTLAAPLGIPQGGMQVRRCLIRHAAAAGVKFPLRPRASKAAA